MDYAQTLLTLCIGKIEATRRQNLDKTRLNKAVKKGESRGI